MNLQGILPNDWETWFRTYYWTIPIVGSGIAAYVLSEKAHANEGQRPREKRVRGMKLQSRFGLNLALNGRALRFNGVELGGVLIPRRLETEHFLIVGSPGAGKSTAMRHLLYQIEYRGQTAIIVDPDSEFIQEFYRESRGDWVLNPLDARCPFWTPQSEWHKDSPEREMDIEATAAALVRGDGPWDVAGRTLVAAVLSVSAGAEQVVETLQLGPAGIIRAINGTPAGALFSPEAKAQASAVIGRAIAACGPLKLLPKKADRQWSAKLWNRKGWIFLSSTAENLDAVRVLQAMWLDLIARQLLSLAIGSETTWVIADEVAALGPQPMLMSLLVRGRKRGAAVVIGMQNIAQLRQIYGVNGAVTFSSASTTKLILRVDEPETAEWASEAIGSYETDRTRHAVVMPAQIQRLKALQGYVTIAGQNRAKVKIAKQVLQPRVAGFIPRTTEPEIKLPWRTIEEITPEERRRESRRWHAIKQRAVNPKGPAAKDYIGRGIAMRPTFRVFDTWLNYLLIVHGLPPADNFTLDRVNNEKGYEPGNLRWATHAEQAANRRNTLKKAI